MGMTDRKVNVPCNDIASRYNDLVCQRLVNCIKENKKGKVFEWMWCTTTLSLFFFRDGRVST